MELKEPPVEQRVFFWEMAKPIIHDGTSCDGVLCPENGICFYELVQIIIHGIYFRGPDHQGESLNLQEDFWLCCHAYWHDKEKLEYFFERLAYFKDEAVKKDFFELATNIKYILDYIDLPKMIIELAKLESEINYDNEI